MHRPPNDAPGWRWKIYNLSWQIPLGLSRRGDWIRVNFEIGCAYLIRATPALIVLGGLAWVVTTRG